jgi:shikimate kinase
MEHIILVGFMGSGKTLLGRTLAEAMGRTFTDLDAHVEQSLGMPIARFFHEQGEDAFRQREARGLSEVLRHSPQVIATGGGTPMHGDAMTTLLQGGVVVWIEAAVEVILERVTADDTRPLLAGRTRDDTRSLIESLLTARTPTYARAPVRVRSDQGSVGENVAKIMHHLHALDVQP